MLARSHFPIPGREKIVSVSIAPVMILPNISPTTVTIGIARFLAHGQILPLKGKPFNLPFEYNLHRELQYAPLLVIRAITARGIVPIAIAGKIKLLIELKNASIPSSLRSESISMKPVTVSTSYITDSTASNC